MASARTSLTHPLQIAEVPAGPGLGRIGITFCPGKHDRAAMSGAWARDLGLDLDAIAGWGATHVVTLVEPQELGMLKVPDLGTQVRARGMDWHHMPIADYSVPIPAFEARWQAEGRVIRAALRAGADVVVHCKGGLGRAGMIAARLLVELGADPKAAVKAVRTARPGAIETPAQLALVRATLPLAEPARVDPAQLTRVGGRLGSNPGGIWADAAGGRLYVKELESPAQAQNEYLAAALYRLAGAPVLSYLPCAAPDQVATVFVDLEKSGLSHLTEAERAQAWHWFGVHAWLANWDAAGFQGDNQGVIGGVVTTLDVGGALEFRAQGDPKGRAFGPEVPEVTRLRDDPDNPFARQLFGPMSPAALRAALTVVIALPDAAIRKVVARHHGRDALAEKLLARKADLARQLSEIPESASSCGT
ncbi:cyclin-dependent kinase inhibitor 3 family protein [Rhodobacter capsulatus]|uniref:cyclin-dependent kinase inhibitor 3 family protein n=1 Tax=Rhodobacter capsulatus TaxID=1061 RepID=UPI0004154F5D|nr:cyclin-dependent kinase inhibitor 3 family protein [Rhodobacter capsulatus]